MSSRRRWVVRYAFGAVECWMRDPELASDLGTWTHRYCEAKEFERRNDAISERNRMRAAFDTDESPASRMNICVRRYADPSNYGMSQQCKKETA